MGHDFRRRFIWAAAFLGTMTPFWWLRDLVDFVYHIHVPWYIVGPVSMVAGVLADLYILFPYLSWRRFRDPRGI